MLFDGELGANLPTRSCKNYHRKFSFRRENFRTKIAAEILPVNPSRLFPLPLWVGLVFAFRRKLPSILEVRVFVVFGYW